MLATDLLSGWEGWEGRPLNQKTCLSVIINNFGGKWVAQIRYSRRLGMRATYHPAPGSGMAAGQHAFILTCRIVLPAAVVVKLRSRLPAQPVETARRTGSTPKVGPDYLDTGWHTAVSSVASRNLDGFMLPEPV